MLLGRVTCRWQSGSGKRWTRHAAQEPTGSLGKKLEDVRMAAAYDYPAGDIDSMLVEIESGYGSGARS